MSLRSFLLIASAVAAAWCAPHALAAERVFDVTGTVRSPLRDGQLVIAHEDIPGFMPAMTMAFAVASPAEAATLAAGDRVRFRLHVNETAARAGDFMVVGRDSSNRDAPLPASRHPRLREGDSVPDFSLVNQDNQPLAAADLRGHFTVVTFIFTRCPVPEYCPAMAIRFAQLQRAIVADPKLAGRTRLLGISIDPRFDRPEILKAYGEAVGADPAIWQFATGDEQQVGALARAFAVFTERNGVTLNHTLCTALLDREGRVVELWRGNGWKADEVVAALAREGAK